jgi:hypothetical protein
MNTIQYEYNTIRGQAYSDIYVFEYSDPPEVPISAIRNHHLSLSGVSLSLANLSIFRLGSPVDQACCIVADSESHQSRGASVDGHRTIATEHFSMDTSEMSPTSIQEDLDKFLVAIISLPASCLWPTGWSSLEDFIKAK